MMLSKGLSSPEVSEISTERVLSSRTRTHIRARARTRVHIFAYYSLSQKRWHMQKKGLKHEGKELWLLNPEKTELSKLLQVRERG